MKSLLFSLICLCVFFASCKTDRQSKLQETENNEETANSKKETPIFTMVEKPISNIEVTATDTIDVNNIEELVASANHNTTLRLKKGKYNLAENLVYYISKEKKEIIDKNVTETRSIGGQIYISGMTNFSIIGNDSEIYGTNPKAIPLFIYKSFQGNISNLKLGHKLSNSTLPKVSSLYVSGSNKLNFNNCRLGNGSKSGLRIQNAKYLTFNSCNISNAQEKIFETIKGKSIQFLNSTIENNKCSRGCFAFLGNENSVEFKNVKIKNNRSTAKKSSGTNSFATGIIENTRFRNCKFSGNTNFDQIGIPEFNLTDCEVQAF